MSDRLNGSASWSMRPLKISIVGDRAVGKTWMLCCYCLNSFPEEYVWNIYDNFVKSVSVDGMLFALSLWDTKVHDEDYKTLRLISYEKTDCFIVCFAIDNPESFANVETKWIPELRQHCPNASIILVGTKSDLRNDTSLNNDCISASDARNLKDKIKASAYMECSAKTQDSLNQVFEAAVRSVDEGNKTTKCVCRIV